MEGLFKGELLKLVINQTSEFLTRPEPQLYFSLSPAMQPATSRQSA